MTAVGSIRGEAVPSGVWLAMAVLGLAGAVTSGVLLAAGGPGTLSAAPVDRPSPTTVPTPGPEGEPEAAGDGAADEAAAAAPTIAERPGTGVRAGPVPDRPDDCPPLFVVHFPVGGARPEGDGFDRGVALLADWLAAHPDAIVLVDGHADSAGGEEANLALSFRRANAVADALVEAGPAGGQVQARGFGEYQAVIGEPPDSERNRRVTMQLDGRPECGAGEEEGR